MLSLVGSSVGVSLAFPFSFPFPVTDTFPRFFGRGRFAYCMPERNRKKRRPGREPQQLKSLKLAIFLHFPGVTQPLLRRIGNMTQLDIPHSEKMGRETGKLMIPEPSLLFTLIYFPPFVTGRRTPPTYLPGCEFRPCQSQAGLIPLCQESRRSPGHVHKANCLHACIRMAFAGDVRGVSPGKIPGNRLWNEQHENATAQGGGMRNGAAWDLIRICPWQLAACFLWSLRLINSLTRI